MTKFHKVVKWLSDNDYDDIIEGSPTKMMILTMVSSPEFESLWGNISDNVIPDVVLDRYEALSDFLLKFGIVLQKYNELETSTTQTKLLKQTLKDVIAEQIPPEMRQPLRKSGK